MSSQRLIVLFDIDLTLIRNPVDRHAIGAALDQATGVPGLLERFDYRGRAERWLVETVAHAHGFNIDKLFRDYNAAYRRVLPEMLASLPPSTLPGAIEVLRALRERPETTLGVETGNLPRERRGEVGARARPRVLRPAARRIRGRPRRPGGDRPRRDARLRCPRGQSRCGGGRHGPRRARRAAAGALPIGVATGHATAMDLVEAGATAVLPDLTDVPRALRAITGE